jgi:hypothetical protein
LKFSLNLEKGYKKIINNIGKNLIRFSLALNEVKIIPGIKKIKINNFFIKL